MKVGTLLTYLHSDHLGSTVMETSNGLMTADQKYFAYGKQRDTNPVTTDHRFTGQKQDGSGLTFMNARYYDSSIGTFISADTIVPSPSDSFSYNRYLYSRANPMNFVDPSGHCILQGLQGSDSKENQQCWQAATQISSLMQNDPDNPVFNGMTHTDFVAYVAPNPFVTFAMLAGILDSYWTDFYTKAGLYHPQYNPAPIPNTGPPDYIIDFDKKFAQILTACARKFHGACGVSTGLNAQIMIVGGRVSLDGYIDQMGRRRYYFTTALGGQVSTTSLGASGSSAYIVAPGATVYDFEGWGWSVGASGAVGVGMAIDLVFTVTDVGPQPIAVSAGGTSLGKERGLLAQVYAEGHAFISYSFVLHDPQQ